MDLSGLQSRDEGVESLQTVPETDEYDVTPLLEVRLSTLSTPWVEYLKGRDY